MDAFNGYKRDKRMAFKTKLNFQQINNGQLCKKILETRFDLDVEGARS